MNRDARAAVLAALRRDLRRRLDAARRDGRRIGRSAWSGKVGMIAGCTPAIDSHHAVIGIMGERFVFYRLPAVDPEAQVRRALGHVGRETAMRAELTTAVRESFWTSSTRPPGGACRRR
ncbi:MAG: hypothetical protein WKF78_06400 [Candidatus Limnocylindrales bacterium]